MRNGDREKLLEDACKKYFSEPTSVKCSIGIKVRATPAGAVLGRMGAEKTWWSGIEVGTAD